MDFSGLDVTPFYAEIFKGYFPCPHVGAVIYDNLHRKDMLTIPAEVEFKKFNSILGHIYRGGNILYYEGGRIIRKQSLFDDMLGRIGGNLLLDQVSPYLGKAFSPDV